MSLKSAILGFLALEPASGYTLKQRFDGSVGSFWTATQSQIYRELHAIEAEGLARVDSVPQDGKPDRKVYALTPKGRTALMKWLAAPLEPLQLRHPLLLKFVFSSEVAPAALDALLADYAAAVTATRDDYDERAADPRIFSLARSKREGQMWKLSIEHGLAWCDMEIAWVKKTREVLSPRSKQRSKR